ncbi:MAG: FAD:protein FMN transferase [Planctomycetota bacterium]
MGVKFRLVLYANSKSKAAAAARAAFDRISRLERIFSDYRANSEARRLTTAAESQTVRVSKDMSRILKVSLKIAAQSGGAFDPTLGALTQQWRRARTLQQELSPAQIETARAQTGWEKLTWSPKDSTLRHDCPGLAFDFGGIAKGDAADEAAKVLESMGYRQYLIDAGGDLRLGAAPPGKTGWSVQLGYQGETRHLSHCGVATSGATFKYLLQASRRQSHILDPGHGKGLVTDQELTCIANNATLADALATAGSVLGEGPKREALARHYSAEFLSTRAPRPR